MAFTGIIVPWLWQLPALVWPLCMWLTEDNKNNENCYNENIPTWTEIF